MMQNRLVAMTLRLVMMPYTPIMTQSEVVESLTITHERRKEKLMKRDIMSIVAVDKDYISLHGRILVPDLDWQ